MKKLKLVLSSFIILSFSSTLAVPVMAHDGVDHSTDNTTKTEEEIAEHKAAEKAEAARAKAEAALAKKMEATQAKAKEVRSKACEARKENIKKRWNTIGEFADKHKGTFENVLERIVQFKEKHNLVINDEVTLLAAIDSAKAEVAADISALQSLKGTVDCNDPDSVASGLEAYKSQVRELRNSLKQYREAIRNYAKAVKEAAVVAKGND